MKITCTQFENLLSFYLNNELNEHLKQKVEEHLKECPHCNMKVKMLNSIINDIKDAYNEIINKKPQYTEAEIVENKSQEINNTELSAYIDNELEDEHNIKIRKNIIAKPKIRAKIDKLYKLRKVMHDSFSEQKNKLKTDFSKDILKEFNTEQKQRETYFHCIGFLLVVVLSLCFSIWLVFNVI